MSVNYYAKLASDLDGVSVFTTEEPSTIRMIQEALRFRANANEDVIARALLEQRGFVFVTTPEEGQDAYDITQDALREARAVLLALEGRKP